MRIKVVALLSAILLLAAAQPAKGEPRPRPAPEPLSTVASPYSPYIPAPYPAPVAPAGAEPLLATLPDAATLREQVRAAQESVALSEASYSAALSKATTLRTEAALAEAAALTAQGDLNTMAASMYINGGTGPVEAFSAALSSSSFSQLADTQYKLEVVSSTAASRVLELEQVKTDALIASQEAAKGAQDAADALERNRAGLYSLRLLLSKAEEAARLAAIGSVAPPSSSQNLIGPDNCPTTAPEGTLRGSAAGMDIYTLCATAVAQAATPAAALAVIWALRQLGAPYACKGVGRMDPFRFDCSSLVSRAYYQGAGIPVAGETWAPSTRNMMPWDGVPLSPWYAFVSPDNVRPGDLALSRTCTKAPCLYQHVVMILPFGLVVQTNSCGDVAHVTDFYGFTDPSFVVARRVMLGGDQGPEITLPFASDATDQLAFVPDPVIPTSPSPAPSKPSGKPAAPSPSPSPATPSPEGTPSPEATPAPEATPGTDATTPPTPEASSGPSSPDQAAPPPASPSS